MKEETLFIYMCQCCQEEFLANTSDISTCPSCREDLDTILGEYKVTLGEIKLYN